METLSLSSNELTEISLEALVDALGGGHGNLPGAQWDSIWIRGVATGCNTWKLPRQCLKLNDNSIGPEGGSQTFQTMTTCC